MKKKNIVNIALTLLGVVIIVFFGMRAVHAFRRFNGHRPPPPGRVETDVELIRDWMTIPFISRMYQIPDEMIFETLNISPKDNREKSLKELNQQYFPDKDGYILELVKTTIRAFNASRAPTTLPAPTAPIAP